MADRRASTVVEDTAAAAVRAYPVRIASGNGEAVEEGCVVGVAAGDDVVAVFIVVLEVRAVIAGQVTAEDRFVGADVPFVWVGRSEAGVAAQQGQVAEQVLRSYDFDL